MTRCRKTITAAAAAAAALATLAAAPATALAVTYTWTTGNFVPGTTAPATLSVPDVLNISGTSSKTFNAVAFTNDSTVNWLAGTIFLGGGATVTNNGLWDLRGDNLISSATGAGTFVNAGTLRKSAGSGVALVGASAGFTNSGTIDVQSGILRLAGGTTTFNAGSVFTGAGAVEVSTAATFNGAFTSSNLVLAGGTQTGAGAVLNGTATAQAVTLAGTWQVASGSTLALTGTASRTVAGPGTVLVNDGTVNWQAGTIFLGGGATVSNNGLWDLQGDNLISSATGAGTFVNAGTLRKSAGSGVALVGASAGFTNSGTIDVQSGILRLAGGTTTFNAGSVFTGAGAVEVSTAATFNGAFTSGNLVLAGGTQTGSGAVLNGTATAQAVTLAGTWQVASGSTLALIGTASRTVAGPGTVLVNNGTVNWQAGTVFLGGGATVSNNGLWDAQGDLTISSATGGGTLVNNGLFRKSAGTGTTGFTGAAGLVNAGVMDVQVGTIALPAGFTNTGTLKGDGRYSLSGTLSNQGTVAPGSAGVGDLDIGGNYAQTASGTLALDLTSLASFDLLAITGSASLGGTLALNCLGACSFGVGDTFTVLTSTGARTGSFSSVVLGGFATGAFDVLYAGNSVSLRVTQAVTAVPEPGSVALLLAGLAAVGWRVRRRTT